MALVVDSNFTECTRCIMTLVDDAYMSFDATGVCNHCRTLDRALATLPQTEAESHARLSQAVAGMKAAGSGRRYDCLLGVSGGVDSTYIALLLKRLGLRPLCVHFDNGWNSELAVQNIDRMISTLGYDLETYVIDWDDFRELQLAYLRAGVIDIEVLTDHAIYGALYEFAISRKVRHIVSGVNIATEFFLPSAWIFDKHDDINIRDIYKKFGSKRQIRRYPFLNNSKRRKIAAADIRIVEILNMIRFNPDDARRDIIEQLGWIPYEGKHHESVFTRFYQGYILPRKFGVDKRKAHLSNLVCSGFITRDQASAEYSRDIYSESQAHEDLRFVCKKLRLSEEEFAALMTVPIRQHQNFETRRWFFGRHPMAKVLLPLWRRYQQFRHGQ